MFEFLSGGHLSTRWTPPNSPKLRFYVYSIKLIILTNFKQNFVISFVVSVMSDVSRPTMGEESRKILLKLLLLMITIEAYNSARDRSIWLVVIYYFLVVHLGIYSLLMVIINHMTGLTRAAFESLKIIVYSKCQQSFQREGDLVSSMKMASLDYIYSILDMNNNKMWKHMIEFLDTVEVFDEDY